MALIWVLPVVTPAGATETLRGASIRIPQGTVVRGDLHIVAGKAQIHGTVDGSLRATVAYLNVVGPIAGDLIGAGGYIEVRGEVHGSVEVASASLALYGRVDGDVVVTGGTITVVEGAEIAGDLVLVGAAAIITDTALVDGNVRGGALDLTIEGQVDGDVRISVRRLELAPTARIGGALNYESRVAAAVAPEAIVAGPITRRDPAERLPLGQLILWRGAALPRLVAMLAVGAAVLLLVPRRAVAVADGLRRAPIATILCGLGVAAFVPLLLLVLTMLVLTFPLAIAGGVAYLAGSWASQVIAGLALGRAIRSVPLGQSRRRANLAEMVIGVVAIASLRLVPVPHLSIVVAVTTAVAGLGAIASQTVLRADRCDASLPNAAPGLRAPVAGFAFGFVAVSLSLAAIALGLAATAAAVLSASNQAFVSWAISPVRVVAIALALVLFAVALAVVAAVIAPRYP
jgi:cytoskeletal protein CcmA (bactofilin family)